MALLAAWCVFAPVYPARTAGDAKTGRLVVGSRRPVEVLEEELFGCSSVVLQLFDVIRFSGPPGPAPVCFDGRILRPLGARTH